MPVAPGPKVEPGDTHFSNSFRRMNPLNAVHRARSLLLKDASELNWMPTEDFILTGYRENYTGYMNVLSLFRLHNQTFSIWTHLFPAIVLPFAYAAVHMRSVRSAPLEFQVLSITATVFMWVQLVVSAMAHTFYNISIRAYRFWWKLDFVLICVGMYAYCFRFGYALLLCEAPYRRAEFYVICAVVCIISLMVTLFHAKETYRLLGMVFVFTVCNVIPQLTMVINGDHQGPHGLLFRPAFGSYGSFGVALVFYILKYPESHHPGRFDVFLSSHQIWHLGIALAHIVDSTYMPAVVAELASSAAEICAAEDGA
jgi:adiponectin receptor